MQSSTLCTVTRLHGSAAVEGALRVHLLPETLENARLEVGDICVITSDDGSVTGQGIAWRASDSMSSRPKNRPAKMTETMQACFGFKEGSKVSIASSTARLAHADKIYLTDLATHDSVKPLGRDDNRWRVRTHSLLANCDAVATGISFEVTSKKKQHRKFCVAKVETVGPPSNETHHLFSVDDDTVIVMPNQMSGQSVMSYSSQQASTTALDAAQPQCAGSFELNMTDIGGLVEQCKQLNRRLRSFQPGIHFDSIVNPPILLHGHEGTGKSLIMDRLAGSPFRKVIRLDSLNLNGGSVAKNKALIEDAFRDARECQPAAVLMDGLEKLVPTDDIGYTATILNEMKRTRTSRVMIVASTRSLMDIERSLLGSSGFIDLIELPVPDQPARLQILDILLGQKDSQPGSLAATISARTHGFTCDDLTILHQLACMSAYHRIFFEKQERLQSEPFQPQTDITLHDYEKARERVKPTALREIVTAKPQIRWADIGGSSSIKETFDLVIGMPLNDKEQMARYPDWKPPKGVLLYGPPGCSKTLTAQAIANTYDLNFVAIKGAALISMYVGESERAVRDVFEKARNAAPCIIFFDEIDAIGGDRDQGGTKGLHVLTTLLNEMDGFNPLEDVFILAATNKPESLDPALMRPGRFDRHVYLGLPDLQARREIIKIALPKSKIDADLERVAGSTDGYSGAEIVRICKSALEESMGRKGAGVSEEDFVKAIEQITHGITKEMLEAYETFAKR